MRNCKKIALSCVILAAALYCSLLQSLAAPPVNRSVGDSRLFAAVPNPGFPEGIAIKDGRVYVSGPAAFGVPIPGAIWVYDARNGVLLDTIQIQNQQGPVDALSCLAFGDDDHLYVLDEALGVIRVNVETGAQSLYAWGFFPFYQSPHNITGAPYLINDLAFDKKGNLYITDSFQAAIWRVPPGGGQAQLWFHDTRLDGAFGPNGIRVDKKGEKLFVAVTTEGGLIAPGAIFTLPTKTHPQAADLQLFHRFNELFCAPDGIAFSKSGRLYVVLAGYNQIAVLNPDGSELTTPATRFHGPASGPNGPVDWRGPANLAFDSERKRVLVTNHADPTAQLPPIPAVFDVYVGEKGGKLFGSDSDED